MKQNRLSRAGFSRVVSFGTAAFMMAVVALAPVAARADDPAPVASPMVDVTALANTAKAEIGTSVGGFMPVVIGIFATMLGIGLLWKWGKRGAKTS